MKTKVNEIYIYSRGQSETAEFIWSILKNLLQYQDKAIIFLWLGTCDFTIKSHTTKVITLRYTTLNYTVSIVFQVFRSGYEKFQDVYGPCLCCVL
jgi:hypothetical protein